MYLVSPLYRLLGSSRSGAVPEQEDLAKVSLLPGNVGQISGGRVEIRFSTDLEAQSRFTVTKACSGKISYELNELPMSDDTARLKDLGNIRTRREDRTSSG